MHVQGAPGDEGYMLSTPGSRFGGRGTGLVEPPPLPSLPSVVTILKEESILKTSKVLWFASPWGAKEVAALANFTEGGGHEPSASAH